jgi:hypothetical protein
MAQPPPPTWAPATGYPGAGVVASHQMPTTLHHPMPVPFPASGTAATGLPVPRGAALASAAGGPPPPPQYGSPTAPPPLHPQSQASLQPVASAPANKAAPGAATKGPRYVPPHLQRQQQQPPQQEQGAASPATMNANGSGSNHGSTRTSPAKGGSHVSTYARGGHHRHQHEGARDGGVASTGGGARTASRSNSRGHGRRGSGSAHHDPTSDGAHN